MKKLIFAIALVSSITSARSFASETNQISAQAPTPQPSDSRDLHKIGAYLGILGDPSPTLAGINAAYNITDYLRLHAGYGQVKATSSVDFAGNNVVSSDVTMTTLGLGALGMVPGWNLTPVIGLSYSHVFLPDNTIIDVKPNNIYATVGVDYQADSGFDIGVGLNQSLNGGTINGAYVNLGWFFL